MYEIYFIDGGDEEFITSSTSLEDAKKFVDDLKATGDTGLYKIKYTLSNEWVD